MAKQTLLGRIKTNARYAGTARVKEMVKLKIADQDIEFLRLIRRSPDVGDGWRTVSQTLWWLVNDFRHQDLIESEKFSDGSGRVRFSARGLVLKDYF